MQKSMCVWGGRGGICLPAPLQCCRPWMINLKANQQIQKDSYFIVYERPPQNQNPLHASVTLILHPVNCETPHDSWLNKENVNSYENKQVWVEARRHQNRKGLFGPNLDHNFFFFFFKEVSALLDIRHCPKLKSCAISRKSYDTTLRKWQKN